MRRLARPTDRRPPDTLVALVDVVFFLLVFALLAGRMDATAPFDVAPPIGATGADLPAGGMNVSIANNGALALDGQTMGRAALLRLAKDRLDADPALRLRINADGTTALRNVLPLVNGLEDIGAAEIVLIVTPDAG